MLLMTSSFVNLDFFSENIEASILSIPSIFNTINFEIEKDFCEKNFKKPNE